MIQTKLYSKDDIHIIYNKKTIQISKDDIIRVSEKLQVFREESIGEENYIPAANIELYNAQPILNFLVNECNMKPEPLKEK